MQGKIALEEHFAIDDTVNDSKGFFPDEVWQEVRSRVLDLHDRRLRLMDEYGIEMMLLSLNAPAVQAIPDPRAGERDCAQGQRLSGRAGGEAAGRASRGWRRCRCRIPISPPGACSAASRSLAFAARWSTASRRSATSTRRSTTTSSSTGRSGRWSSSSTCRSICIRATRWRAMPGSTRAIPGCSGPIWAFGQETAVHSLRLMGSGLFDAYPRHPDRARPHGRRPAVQHVARRQLQRVDREPAQSAPVPRKTSRTISTPTSTSPRRATSATRR